MTIEKATNQAPEEVGEEKDDQEVVDTTKDVFVKDGHEGGTKKEVDEEAIAEEEEEQDQNVPEVQISSVNPPHVDQES